MYIVTLKNLLIKKHKNLIPLAILVLIFINTVIDLLFISYKHGFFVYKNSNIIAGIVLIISLFSYFKVRKYYKYFIVCTLLLGLTNLVDFLSFKLNASMGLNSFSINFQPLIFLLFVLIYFLNYRKANSYWAALFLQSPSSIAKQQDEQNLEQVEKFKLKYASLTNQDLLEIINNGKFVKQAVVVAKQILDERNNKNNDDELSNK
jgi:hypothetical protein